MRKLWQERGTCPRPQSCVLRDGVRSFPFGSRMWFLTRVCCFLPLLHPSPLKSWDWADEFISKALPVKLPLRTQRSVCAGAVLRCEKLKWPDVLIPLAWAKRRKKNTQHPVCALWLTVLSQDRHDNVSGLTCSSRTLPLPIKKQNLFLFPSNHTALGAAHSVVDVTL